MGELDVIDRSVDRWCRLTSVVERVGPFELFVEPAPFSPKYARPRAGARASMAEVEALTERCRALAVPAEVEAVHECHPWLADVLRASHWQVTEAPLLVHRPDRMPPPLAVDVDVRVVRHDDPALARIDAIGHVAFGSPGMTVGPEGRAEADLVAATHDPASNRERLRREHMAMMAAFDGEHAVAYGSLLLDPSGAMAEIVAVGTVPSHRRRGIGATITSGLVQEAHRRGVGTVWLSAANQDVASLYERLGFERLGTYLMGTAPDRS